MSLSGCMVLVEQLSNSWRERHIQSLREIESTETLLNVFLEDGRIHDFPEHERILYLAGHVPRTHDLYVVNWQINRLSGATFHGFGG